MTTETTETKTGKATRAEAANELYEIYFALLTKHSLDGTRQFGEYKALEDAAKQRVLDADPSFFLKREAEAMAEARARYAA